MASRGLVSYHNLACPFKRPGIKRISSRPNRTARRDRVRARFIFQQPSRPSRNRRSGSLTHLFDVCMSPSNAIVDVGSPPRVLIFLDGRLFFASLCLTTKSHGVSSVLNHFDRTHDETYGVP